MSTLATTLPAVRSRATHAWLAVGLVLVGLGLAVNSLLGPLGAEVVDFRITGTLRNQMIGLDVVSLVVVAPVAVMAAVLVLRDHVAGFALALGVGSYSAYMLLQYVLGPDYTSLPGNSERLFPLYLVLFAFGWIVTLAAWADADGERLRAPRRRELLLGRVVLPALAFLTFSRYVPALADAMSPEPTDAGYLAGPAFFWSIALMDLGIFVPATIAACAGLVRGRAWAGKALYLVVGWFGLVGPAVAAMAIAMYANDDPNASGGATVFMAALGLAFLVLALGVFRPLFGRR